MASSIVASVGNQLGTLLVQEAKFLFDVSDKIENLQKELLWMHSFLEDADNKEHKEKRVSLCVAEIRDFAFEAEDVIERYIHEVSHHRPKGTLNTIKWFSCICGDAVPLHSVGSCIDELSTKITEMGSRLQRYGVQSIKQPESSTYDSALREKRRTYSHTEEKTVGLESHIKEVVDKLVKENKANVVGISGIGGLGKTTLARKVYSDEKVKQHFKNCVWVYISKQFERRSVFEEILIELSCSGKGDDARNKIKQLTDQELPREICKVLEEEECLVLLDDMWTTDAWDILKPAFESIKRSRSKILITTRNMELVRHADLSGYTHPFGVLSDEDAWTLLEQTAFPEENKTVDEVKAKMEELGKKMLKHCKGLPLAIVALGGILATKGKIHEWETVSRNITSYMSDEVREGGGDKVLPVLELSYDDLPFYLKPCFMYLGIFPEDYEISADRLYHLWEAEGLVTMPDDQRGQIHGVAMDDIAETYLNQLVNRSMVQVDKRWPDGSIKSCRLHDIMRDMCLNKCRQVNFLQITDALSDSDTVCASSMNKKSRRHAVYSKIGFGVRSLMNTVDQNEAPYKRSLFFNCDGSSWRSENKLLSPNMGKFFSLLRVLDICGGIDVEGAGALKYCIHLRYLSFRGVRMVGVIDGIWDCKYLETLDLRFDYLNRVKLRNELWKLGRLRHLYLPEYFTFVNHDNYLRLTLVQLRQIETFVNFSSYVCQMEDLRKMISLRNFSFRAINFTLSKDDLGHLMESPFITAGRLKSPLKLSIRAEVINEDPTILASSSLKSICIDELQIWGSINEVVFSELGENASNGFKVFPSWVTKLELNNCEIGEKVILELEKLPYLEELQLRFKAIRDSKMSFSQGSFKKLRKLRLSYMKNIKELEVGEGVLLNLISLDLGGMENLKEWEVGEGALPNLISLEISYCEIGEKGIMELEKLPCLEELKLFNKAIRDSKMSFSQGSFKQLRELKLFYLENLKEWEVGEGALPNLVSLEIRDCALERIPEGLPTSMKITIIGTSDINGSEKYQKKLYLT